MRKPLFLLLLATMLLSCHQKEHKLSADSCCIEGEITHADHKTIVLQKLDFNEVTTIDSVTLKKDGKFRFTLNPLEKEIYLLRKDGNHYISIIAVKGENIIFRTDYENFEKTYTIKGSPDSELLMELNMHLQPNLHTLDSIGNIWKTAINAANRVEIKKDLDVCYHNIVADQRAFQLQFILKNSTSLAALIALYQPLNREPVLKEENDFAVFEKVSADLLKTLPTNSHAVNFAKRIKQHNMLELEKELNEKKMLQHNH